MNLALFDLDNTLLLGDSDFEWARFLIDKGVLDAEVYEARNTEFYDQYRAGTLDIHEFLAFQLKPLSRHPRTELDAFHAQYMAARMLVRTHRDAGALVAIVTATNSFVTGPIAREFGVPHLIATEPEQLDGRYTGRVAGIPSFREGKVARVDAWLAEQGRCWSDFERSFFYSDSANDLPLLSRVTDPVAVDPDPGLESHARQHGWPVISLRAAEATGSIAS